MPNFFTLRTIAWQNGKVRMIDQSKLPERLNYAEYRRYSEIVKAIRNMVVRGAPAIGVAGAMGMALAALESQGRTKNSLLRDLRRAKKVLDGARPTAVNMSWATQRILNVATSMEDGPKSVIKAIVEEAKMMADEDFETNRTLGRIGSASLKDGDVVLTHCK